MPLYELTSDAFRSVAEVSLIELKLRERGDLQRLLRSQIDVLADDLYVITEEFCEWDDSRRRIDLLAIDKNAKLVVIELKRNVDGAYMDLQAVRYASMVSTMRFSRAVEVHADFLGRVGLKSEDAQQRLMAFLGWDEPNEEDFASDVRIILVSEDFGKELTTTVLWLRDHDIDISCVRLKPYQNGTSKLIDVQQIIPLPEANEYQVQVREKEQEGKKKKAERHEERIRFWQGLIALAKEQKGRHANVKPGPYNWIGCGSGIRGLNFIYYAVQDSATAELYIDRGDESENKRIFDELFAQKDAIEQAFGERLVWDRLDGKRASRIKHLIATGGYRTPESQWQQIHSEMLAAMNRLEAALKASLGSLDL